jgi:adenine C2-methylase RlmN of 23S rRNA A2503 and tRNA A37
MLHQTVSTNALIGSRFSAFNVTCWIGVWLRPLRISKGQDIQGACGQLRSEQGLAVEEGVR